MSRTPGYQRGRLFGEAETNMFASMMRYSGSASAPSSCTRAKGGNKRLSLGLLEERLCALEDSFSDVEQPAPSNVWGQSELLRRKWSFWVDTWGEAGGSTSELKELCTVDSIKTFWDWFNALEVPKIKGMSWYLFKQGLVPRWEDEANRCGGHFTILVPEEEQGGKLWMDLALATVAEQFEGNDLINGAGISNKGHACTLQLWLATRDKTLQDMVQFQLIEKLGNLPLLFKPHNRIATSPPSQRGTVELNNTTDSSPIDRIKQELEQKMGLWRDIRSGGMSSRRRPSSAPAPIQRTHLLSSVEDPSLPAQLSEIATDLLDIGRSATDTMIGANEEEETEEEPVMPIEKPTLSKAAKRAGIRCLNPTLVETNTELTPAPKSERKAPRSTMHASRGRGLDREVSQRRSRSDNDRVLCIPSLPLPSTRARVGPQTTSFKAFAAGVSPMGSATTTPQSHPMHPEDRDLPRKELVPLPPGPSPVKAWADSAWAVDSPSLGGAPPKPSSSGNPTPPTSALPAGKAGAGGIWARKQKDDEKFVKAAQPTVAPQQQQQQQQQQPATLPHDARGFSYDYRGQRYPEQAQGAVPFKRDVPFNAGGTYTAPSNGQVDPRNAQPDRRIANAAPSKGSYTQGKSCSSAFTHSGYLFPPGLNRKQRRTIIFANEQRKGEVASIEGVWMGDNVPDGNVTEEEYNLLRAGKLDPRHVTPQPNNGWGQEKEGEKEKEHDDHASPGRDEGRLSPAPHAEENSVTKGLSNVNMQQQVLNASNAAHIIAQQQQQQQQHQQHHVPMVNQALSSRGASPLPKETPPVIEENVIIDAVAQLTSQVSQLDPALRATSPIGSIASRQSDLPSPPALGPPMTQLKMQQLQEQARLNPEAASFVPVIGDPRQMIEPPTLLNGMLSGML